jgi:cytosine/adenosine deaminase-related metal-dependent hydrolase
VHLHELIGFAGVNAEEQVAEARRAVDAIPAARDLRPSLAPHAPYSVSPALFAAIRSDLEEHGRQCPPCTSASLPKKSSC